VGAPAHAAPTCRRELEDARPFRRSGRGPPLIAAFPEPAVEVLLCPPATLIARMAWAWRIGPAVGGQDCHPKPATRPYRRHLGGDAGRCRRRHVILGHSERRTDHGETTRWSLPRRGRPAAGLIAIVCLGETEDERDAGQTLGRRRPPACGSLPEGATPANTVVAYEPVWAIGSGRTPTAGRDRRGARLPARNRLQSLRG
jgi:triosephosphate isomerase (TIM)